VAQIWIGADSYDAALSLDGRSTAYCLAHARRKFDELFKANASVVAGQAIQRLASRVRHQPRQVLDS
jgi:hypothetical protein